MLCMLDSKNINKISSYIRFPVHKYTLHNGLRVILSPNKNIHTASYLMGVCVGSRQEQLGITGISHMFEHLMFKGTKKYPQFDKTYADHAVTEVNAFTSYDYTAYHASFQKDQLELVLDVESNRLSQLKLTQKELDMERSVVQEERLMGVDNNPSGIAMEKLFELSFKKHAYRHPIIGYKKDIANYDLKKLNTWYKHYYSPNNAVLVISGNFSVKEAKKHINKYFACLKSQTIIKKSKIIEPEQRVARYKSITKQVKSPFVRMACVCPKIGSREAYALEIISHILSSGESSVLYQSMVRESKLLSYISTGLWSFIDYSVFLISYPLLQLDQEKHIKSLMLKNIQKGLAKSITKYNLEKVKNIHTNQLLFSLKKDTDKLFLLSDFEIQLGDYKKLYEKLDILHGLSSQFIKQVGEKYLQAERFSCITVKNQNNKAC